jgi:hypothetical protein
MSRRPVQGFLASAALALTAGGCFWPVPGQDPDRTAHNESETAIAPGNVDSLHQVWSAGLDGAAGDPVTSRYGVVVSGLRTTYSLAPESGNVRWSHTEAAPLAMTQPFVRSDKVLVGRWDPTAPANADTEGLDVTLTLDAQDGTPLGSPVGGQLVALRGDRAVFWDLTWFPARVGGPFWAPELWVRDLDSGSSLCCGGFYDVYGPESSPPPEPFTLGSGRIFAAGYYFNDPANPIPSLGNGVRALGTDTRPNCFQPYTCPDWGIPIDGSTSTAPVLNSAERVAYVGTDAGTLYAVDTEAHSILWSRSIGSAITDSPALAGGTLYVPSAAGPLFAIDAATGAIEWAGSAGSKITQQPAVAGGVVFTGSANGTVAAYDAAGCGNSLCPKLWSASTGSEITGAPAVSVGRLYVGTADGHVVAFAL